MIHANFHENHCISTKDLDLLFLEASMIFFLEVSTSSYNKSIIRFLEHCDIQSHFFLRLTTSYCCNRWNCQSLASYGRKQSSSYGVSIWTYIAQFTARKWKPTTMVVLSGVNQNKKETLHEFIDSFTKVAIALGTNDGLKHWMFKKGLRWDSMFQEKLGLEEACNFSDLSNMAKPYIHF